MNDDGPPLTPDDVDAAASVGRLPALARQLVLDGSWASLDVVLRYARDERLALADLEDTLRAFRAARDELPENRRAAAAEELQALQAQSTTILLRRLDHEPLTSAERKALGLAGSLLVEMGRFDVAARVYERAGDDMRAAEAYGALGDLDRMETCIARDDERRLRQRRTAEVLRRFEVLLAAGERRAALAAAATLDPAFFEGASTIAAAHDVERRLCRGRAVTLRFSDGMTVRLAGVPATIGRETGCQVPLRDPGVSRRHLAITAGPAGLLIEDLGSRAGTRLAGAALTGALPLPPQGELSLGPHVRLQMRTLAPFIVELLGTTGLDRGMRAIVGASPLALSWVRPDARGLQVRFDQDGVRLERTPEVGLRLGGRLLGPGCDLAHGDVLEADGPIPFTLEVL